MASAAEVDAMARAIAIAQSAAAPYGPNPRVGCVLLDPSGIVLAEGFHQGIGTPHAEVVALSAAAGRARGATAVVTLEPCRHSGRTGPCTRALQEAGIARVVYAQSDPNPIARGGGEELAAAGLSVEAGVLSAQATKINEPWSVAVARGWPFVTLKLAASLDGKVAAADGSSRWISGPESRRDTHEFRSQVDAVAVGTGTLIADDPALTDRRPGANRQPIRVIIGERAIPADAKVRDGGAPLLRCTTHDLAQALSEMFDADIRHVLIEGGPTLATAFLKAGLVDQLRWHVAPAILGAGLAAVADLGISNVNAALRFKPIAVTQLGADVRIDLVPNPERGA